MVPSHGAVAQTQVCPLAPGCTRTAHHTVPFETSGQSLWGPGTSAAGSEVWLFDDSWNEGGNVSDRADVSTIFGTQKFGGGVRGESSGRFGMKFVFENSGNASVDVRFPVDVGITFPEPNTYRPGDAVTIRTSWTRGPGTTMTTEMDGMDFSLQTVFAMHQGAGYEVCFFSCSGSRDFFPSFTVPETTFPILDVTGGQLGIADEVLDLTDEAAIVTNFFTGISLIVKRPAPLGEATVSGNRITASGSAKFVDLNLDVDRFLQFIGKIPSKTPTKPPLPIALGGSLQLKDYGLADLKWETVDLDTGFELTDVESVAFEAAPQVRVDFPMEMGYHVTDPAGNVTESGSAVTVSFPAGHSLTVYTPATVDPVDVTPTFSLDNTFSREAQLNFYGDFTNTEMELEFSLARHDFTYSRWEDVQKRVWKSCSDLDDLSDVWDCFTGAITGFYEYVTDSVLRAYDYIASATEADLGPLYQKSFARTDESMDILDASWSLAGFEEHGGAAFTLDPEDPHIAVSTSVVNSLLATGLDGGTVTQEITVANTGDVPLNAAQVLDALAVGGLDLAGLQSYALSANGGFDGGADAATLASAQTLPVGGTATMTLRWNAAPGLHTTVVEASGTSPIGTTVGDAAPIAFGWVPMDIKPKKIGRKKSKKNGKSDKARLPVELYGSPGIPVTSIDPSSLALEGAPIVNYKIEDEDGRMEMKVKFYRQSVLAGLDARLAAGVVAPSSMEQVVFEIVRRYTPGEVAAALWSGGAKDEVLAMDRAGNGNGRLDVGDLRAAVQGTEGGQVVLAGKKEKKGKDGGMDVSGDRGDAGKDGMKGTPHTLILTGSLTDGTPIWAEASVLIKDDKGDDR